MTPLTQAKDLALLPLRLARQAPSLIRFVGGAVIDAVSGSSAEPASAPPPRESARPVPPREPVRSEAPDPSPPTEPASVNGTAASAAEGDTLVAESHDPGAEHGAGPEIDIEEPWEGYSELGSPEIIERLESSDAATAAAVRLYEAANRGRRAVLAAADGVLDQHA
ncbi:MAG: hypothetical protein H0V29_07595 [Thermoleophilaceae bacterium]|nr:hypothetical protein [Thermoleophilaceae bacterium]